MCFRFANDQDILINDSEIADANSGLNFILALRFAHHSSATKKQLMVKAEKKLRTEDQPATILFQANAPQQSTLCSRIIFLALLLALFSSAFAIDPFAQANFDAPKRFLLIISALIGTTGIIFSKISWPWTHWSGNARGLIILAGFISVWIVLSSVFSAHPAQAKISLRWIFCCGIFLLLGASKALHSKHILLLLKAAMFVLASSCILSLLQFFGIPMPFQTLQWQGRFDSGGLLGNEGYVALSACLLGCVCLAVLILDKHSAIKIKIGLLLILSVGTIFINQQRTSLIVLFMVAIALLGLRLAHFRFLKCSLGLLLAGIFIFSLPGVSTKFWSSLAPQSLARLQSVTTYRTGAWISAHEMIQARPWFGFGPGSYSLESTAQRLQAEANLQRRFKLPLNASAHVHAHQDFLQSAAEFGLPSLFGALTALGILIFGLIHQYAHSKSLESGLLFALLLAGMLSALTWFPMQIPLTGVILFISVGRAWRCLAEKKV